MIYVTGDMHGDIERLYDREWKKLKKGDVLIVCGDFGFVWNGGKQEKDILQYLGSRKYTVAFVDGTHDNYGRIEDCRTTYWKGGMVHRVSENLLHLMRGQIFNIDGTSIFAFGGGESNDKDMRVEQGFWWRQEMPSPEEMASGAEKLDEVRRHVDYIVTHEPPSLVKSAMLLRSGNTDRVNKLNGYFDQIDRICDFEHWYFGSLHEDRTITPKHTCVFKKLVALPKPEQAQMDMQF